MSERTRSELFDALRELLDAMPDYRFGQAISNLALLARGGDGDPVYEVEDDELLAAALKHLQDWRRSHPAVA